MFSVAIKIICDRSRLELWLGVGGFRLDALKARHRGVVQGNRRDRERDIEI